MSDMVNHPSHYIGGEGRPECIELINDIICGHQGVAAFCIGQVKYLYRAGKKSDSDMSIYQKALEDVKKFKWYINYIISEYKRLGWHHHHEFLRKEKVIPTVRKNFIANEFSIGKDDRVGELIFDVVLRLTKIYHVEDYEVIAEVLDLIIIEMELKLENGISSAPELKSYKNELRMMRDYDGEEE